MKMGKLTTTLTGAAVALTVLLPATAAAARPASGTDPVPRPRPPVTTPPVVTPPPVGVPTPTVPPVGMGTPRYKVEALNFTADDESGVDWTGSDEPVWVFTATDASGAERTVSQEFGDVDSGETRSFTTARCVVTNCGSGVSGPVGLAVQLVESDGGSEADIRNYVHYGLTAAQWIAKVFGVDASVLDGEVEDYLVALIGDDLMGSANLVWSPAELAAALPAVGATYHETIRLGESGGDLPDFLDNPPDYTLRLRLTRLADAPPVLAPVGR